ncbi:hypothetical protein EDEG_00666 [Edhazardia aedis USNM 41457]|uniref:Uncharacterized protein n=1 Tax=Edhazardia aedis (strain USNM 41457) TaxID=1003232 RepID=J9DRR1_EDHAE|nr:hypothetical protein EDEG_00666 [Edhazardia aedis USNM 41457]|eukprot:EJW05255.1 hypothetical protein EDEG_00666 [Edhazardia aedis USNM 41457]
MFIPLKMIEDTKQIDNICLNILKIEEATIENFKIILKKLRIPTILRENANHSFAYTLVQQNILSKDLSDYLIKEYAMDMPKKQNYTKSEILLILVFDFLMKNPKASKDLILKEEELLSKELEILLFKSMDTEKNNLIVQQLNEQIKVYEEHILKLTEENSILNKKVENHIGDECAFIDPLISSDKKIDADIENQLISLRNRFEIEHKIIKNAWYKLANYYLKKI